jgi:hypothetical protein
MDVRVDDLELGEIEGVDLEVGTVFLRGRGSEPAKGSRRAAETEKLQKSTA